MANDLNEVFLQLSAMLRKHAVHAQVVHDSAEHFYLNQARPDAKGKPIFLAAVKIGTGKVAFHLMPVYTHPSLLEGISPALKKRMQGKSCFNFAAVDAALFAELAALTDAAITH